MALDSDPIVVSKRPDDLPGVIMDIVAGVQFKLISLIFVVFLLITSDVFINRILTKFSGAVEYKYTTTYGTCIQGLFFVLFYVLIDVGIRQGII